MPALAFAVSCLGLCLLAMAQPTQLPRPYVFGINLNAANDWECRMAVAAGCTNTRIGAGWDIVERVPGVYDWREPDRQVDHCLAYGLEPFFLVVATPPWALPEEARDKPFGHAPLPTYYPHAERFYRMLAARYRGKVRYYEFWNEQNGYGWHATNRPEEYAPLLQLAYRALKQGDPDCVVAVGGLDGAGWKGYPRYLERLYDLGCGDSFDAVAVHPYRWDGPLDTYGIEAIHEVLVRHGHGHRLLWLTEYGWDGEYGHNNSAKWLAESLDILTSPEYWYVFQASIHTLTDFGVGEFGMLGPGGAPRPAYQVFRDYPKQWHTLAARHALGQSPAENLLALDGNAPALEGWTSYGDGMQLLHAAAADIRPETGRHVLVARAQPAPVNGGAYRVLDVPDAMRLRLVARCYTDQSGSRADNVRCRVGIDPEGGTDPAAARIRWGKWRDTSGAWDTLEVGNRVEPIVAAGGRATVFLAYKNRDAAAGQLAAFASVAFYAETVAFTVPAIEPVSLPPEVEKPERVQLPAPRLRALPAVSPERVRFAWPEGFDSVGDALQAHAGHWVADANGAIVAQASGERQMFLFAEASETLPAGDWELVVEVESAGHLDVGLWVGDSPDDCVMGILSSSGTPFQAWCLARRDGDFGPRQNESVRPVKPGVLHRVALSRHGSHLNFWLDDAWASAYDPLPGTPQRFGLYVLGPDRGAFRSVRLLSAAPKTD